MPPVRRLLIAFASLLIVATGAASCKIERPARGTSVRRSIAAALKNTHPDSKQASVVFDFLAVCGEWALVDAVVCEGPNGTLCPEGGYSLLHHQKKGWKVLWLPDIADCDAMESPFIEPQNGCLAATLKKYPAVPRQLFAAVKRQ